MSASSLPSSAVDLFSDEALLNPYRHYRALRDAGPVVWLERLDAYAVTRFGDVRAALRNWAAFSSSRGVSLNEAANGAGGMMTITNDPPLHTALRAISGKPLRAAAMRDLTAQVEAEAERLADRLVAKGSFDAIADLAWHLPLSVVSHLVGVPEAARQQMAGWAEAAFDSAGPLNSRTARNMGKVQAFFGFLMNPELAGQLKPGSWGRDIFEAAGRGEIAPEACPMLLADYLIPSLDTTVSAIGSAILLLGRHPAQWDDIRADPDLIPNAILETIRLETPIPWFSRYVAQAVEVDGVAVPENARVMLIYASANRDERKWQDPERFDIHRRAVDHLGFGHGVHMCMGMHLAQFEIRSLLKSLARRVKRFDLGSPEYAPNAGIRGLSRLPVTVVPA